MTRKRRTPATPEEIVNGLIDAKVPTDIDRFTVAQVAEVLGLSDRTVLYMLKDHRLGYFAAGKKGYRVPRAVLFEHLMQSFVPGEISEAQRELDRIEQAIEERSAHLADLNLQIVAAEARLADLAGNDLVLTGRSTQTVP